MEFSDRLRGLREDADLSRKDLAKDLGISYWALSKYETGHVPDHEVLVKIADRFRVTVDFLLGRGGPRSVQPPVAGNARFVVLDARSGWESAAPETQCRYLSELFDCVSKLRSEADRLRVLQFAQALEVTSVEGKEVGGTDKKRP